MNFPSTFPYVERIINHIRRQNLESDDSIANILLDYGKATLAINRGESEKSVALTPDVRDTDG